MKVTVSIPDAVFEQADELAARFGISRSELYRRALDSILEATRGQRITDKLDSVYGAGEGALDPSVARVQAETYAKDEEW